MQANAQQNELVHLKRYAQEQGLGSYNVRKVFQDSKGFIWVATQEGLDRFDGNNIVSYKKNTVPKHKLSGIDVREIIEDSLTHTLWILTAENAVNCIDLRSGNVIRSILLKQENPNDWNLSMCIRGKKLLIGSLVGTKIYNSADGSFIENLTAPVISSTSTDAHETRCIKTDPNGNTWVTYGGYGIVVYDKLFKIIARLPLAKLQTPVAMNVVWFNNLTFTANNEVLVATNAGLRRLKFDKNYNFEINNQPCEKAPFLNTMSIEDAGVGVAGEIYIAGAKNLYKFDRSLSIYTILQETQSETEGGWLSNVLQIYRDKQNNIWLGCQQGLAFISMHNNPFQAIYQDKVTKDKLEHVMSVWKLRSDSLLVGLQNGLALINKNTGRFSASNRGYTFHHIFEDPFNRIHVSRSDGMFIYREGKLVPVSQVYPEFTPYSSSRLNSHVFLGDSIIILGTENNSGILVWNFLKHQIVKIDEHYKKIPLASGIVNTVFKDKKRNLWVLSDNTINIISENFSRSKVLKLYDSINQQFAGLYFDMCESNGYYWIASYGTGIIQLDSLLQIKKIYNTADGLTNDGVYQIYPHKNNIIITTNNGLSVLNLNTHSFQKYYHTDGLHSNGFEEAAGMAKEGIIYAGGLNGFTIINPELFSGNYSPPILYINKIVLETTKGKIDTADLYFQSFSIPNNTLQTNIYFSGLNYSNPTRTVYAYRILERSKDWIDLNNINFVTLIGLSPGTYHLQVKAANEDGIWSEPKELVLIFQPKWYQTWWFYLLIALTVAGILYALYRYRIAQIKKQHEIRKNIATDLHDDLGSTLNSVKVFTNLAISGVKQEESLQQVKDNLTEATMSLRDMIWVLDDSLDTVDELITRLKQFTMPVAGASNIEVVMKADSDLNSRQLIKEEKRNLFLICKEAINNSIKYSGASQIDIAITASGKKIQIIVADNGKGFNVDEVKKGYGLKNMQYRAGQIKYKVVLQSSIGNGTQVQIQPM